jgi:membrane protein DedA with SNARE-associated domain
MKDQTPRTKTRRSLSIVLFACAIWPLAQAITGFTTGHDMPPKHSPPMPMSTERVLMYIGYTAILVGLGILSWRWEKRRANDR